jgi:hypothetical protein
MAHPPNLLPLKVLVISLGFVLIGGTVFLFAAIAGKAGHDLKIARACPDVTLNLAGKGAVQGITPQGDTVQVTLVTQGQTKLLTVDRCTGKLEQTLTVVP